MTWKKRFGAARMALAMLLAAGWLASIAGSSGALEFTVTNTADSGPGSLRQAVIDAAGVPGTDVIRFLIVPSSTTSIPAGPVTFRIVLTSPITVTSPVIIDGTTQPGYAGSPLIGLTTVNQLPIDGLVSVAGSDGSTVRGLSLTGFNRAIVFESSSNRVEQSWVGFDTDAVPLSNDIGIDVPGNDNLIGQDPSDRLTRRNTISANITDGVRLGGLRNVVAGNYIGVSPDAFSTSGNGTGVRITGSENRVGGPQPVERNVISGNGDGIRGESSAGVNTIVGNSIGTDPTGNTNLGNSGHGVNLFNSQANVGGSTPGAGNLISGNRGAGISVSNSSGTVIQGNVVGADIGRRNVIGNSFAGIQIDGGSDYLIGGTATGAGNLIAGNGSFGESFFEVSDGIAAFVVSGLTVQGNTIGTDVLPNRNGVLLMATTNAQIGGAAPGAGNVISGNDGYGVVLACGEGSAPISNTIQGNRIGTDASGTVVLGNESAGILVPFCARGTQIGGIAGAGNIISGNSSHGIVDQGTDDAIEGNLIGVGATGAPLGNGGSGVVVEGLDPRVGGTAPGAGNTIAFNADAGVTVTFSSRLNPIRFNRIFSNGGLGIDLGGNGVTPNDLPPDADAGPNDLQNFPTITTARVANGTLTVNGFLESLPSTTFFIDVYSNDVADPSGNGEGRSPIGTAQVTTNAAGFAPFTFTGTAPAGERVITTTATEANAANDGNTSEFSVAVSAVGLTTQASPSVPIGGTITDTATLTGTTGGSVTFFLYGPDNATCAAPPVFTSPPVPVTADGQYTSAPFQPAAAGTYRWVASYTDVEGITTSGACNDPGESVFVTTLNVSLTTQASTNSTTVAPGTSVTDLATLSPPAGGPAPTGSVTYTLVGPNPGAGCTAPAVGTSTVPVGSPSAPIVVTAPGTYNFVATYSGDANYSPITTPVGCGVPAEMFGVSVPPTTTTSTTTLPPTTTTTTTTLPPTTTTTTTLPPTTITTTTTLPPTTSTLPTTTTRPTTTTTTSTTTLPPTTTTRPPTTITTSTTTTLPPTTTTTVPPTTTTLPPTTTTLPPTTTTLPPTTTTLPPPGTTTTVPFPAPTTVPTTIPVTTTVPPSTTSTAPPSTTVPPSSTTAPPTTIAPPPPGPPSLNAVTPDDVRTGPPGVLLNVSGGGYAGCSRVYFFFDGVRIGTDTPDASGFVDADGLSIPGDAAPGEHTVTSSCSSSGGPVRASSTFLVTEADIHRSAFATSLPEPDQVSFDVESLITSAAIAGLVILLFAFPSKLFNGTVEENYDEIRAWFGRPARAVETASSAARTVGFFVLSLLAGITLGFLNPDFGLDLNSAVLALAFTASLIVMSVGWSLPAAIGIHRQTGEWGKLNFLPGTLVVSVVMVVICRRLQIQPGYFYGALAGLAFASALSKQSQGRLTAANWSWALAISLAAWFARVPVSEAAAQPEASVAWIGLEAFLVMTFLWGVETLAVAMLPMRFLDGPKVRAWNRGAWAALLFAGVFITVHVLLTPTSGYVGQTETEVALDVLTVFLVFCAISVGAWAYFRYRPERFKPRAAR